MNKKTGGIMRILGWILTVLGGIMGICIPIAYIRGTIIVNQTGIDWLLAIVGAALFLIIGIILIINGNKKTKETKND